MGVREMSLKSRSGHMNEMEKLFGDRENSIQSLW